MASLDRFDIADGATLRGSQPLRTSVSLLVLADIVFLIAFAAGFFDTHHWFDEDGPVEDLQALALAIAAAIAVWRALEERREGRLISFGLTAMFIASCVRELEFRGTGAPAWFAWFFHGIGQNIVIATTFAVFGAYAVAHWRQIAPAIRAFLQPRTIFYIVAGAVLLLSGIAEGSERRFGNPAEDVEEWLELNGYLLFLFAALYLPYKDRLGPTRG